MRALVQLYDAREVFQTLAAAAEAAKEAAATLNDGGVTFSCIPQNRGDFWYVVARRKATRQLVGYVGVAWED